MKPTGRRAWRKWAKKQRYKTNRGLRRSGAEYRNDATGAWYKRQRAFFDGRPSVLVKSFTPRSLVGMTMGARKRAAFRDLEDDRFLVETLAKIVHTEERTKYRIGERLRPCPGCSVCARPCDSCEMLEPDDSRCPRCGQVMYSMPICDGSGVLPARRPK